MSYEEALDELMVLVGGPVALEVLITRPADPNAKSGDLRWSEKGTLNAPEGPRSRFRILPDGSGLMMDSNRFRSARREGNELVIEVAAFEYRLSRLSHRDFAALSHKASPRAMEKLR